MRTKLQEDFASAVSKVRTAPDVQVQDPTIAQTPVKKEDANLEAAFIGVVGVDGYTGVATTHPLHLVPFKVWRWQGYTHVYFKNDVGKDKEYLIGDKTQWELDALEQTAIIVWEGFSSAHMIFEVVGRDRDIVRGVMERFAKIINALKKDEKKRMETDFKFQKQIVRKAVKP